MKTKHLFFAALACMTLSACNNDEVPFTDPTQPEVFTGDEAYMKVILSDAGAVGTKGSDQGFEYGTAEEHAVVTAHFYFYDENKNFISEGNVWNGGQAETGTPAGNIEFKSETVVVLKELTEKNYPMYMVTVLNRPATFKPGKTLGEMEQLLADENGLGIWNQVDGTNYFTMSTTSYKRSDATPYFVSLVGENNFSLEPIAETIPNPVVVYVERLAAKVTVDVSEGLAATAQNGLYPIQATVAGDPNHGDTGEPAAEELYIELLGWKLNATAKHSYMMKNIDETWAERFGSDLSGFAWNDVNNFRSYWGMSFNYGQTEYPEGAEQAENAYLNYVDLSEEGRVALGESAYCAENTNTSEVVSANFPSAVTSVLLSARVCDAEGDPLDLVRFNGVLFTQEGFLSYILTVLNTEAKLNYYVQTAENAYAQLDNQYFALENVADGVVKVVSNVPEGVTVYAKDGDTYTVVTDLTTLDSNLAAAATDAIGYNGGLMYYNIPIEHLNNDAITEGDTKVVPEGKYGVVRNHHYVVSINKLENLGKGIFNPDEAIVPSDDDKETYYVGATINILSWKLVNQNVDL